MSSSKIPGFTAEASLYTRGQNYQTRACISNSRQVIPQLSAFCIHAANRAYDRCRLIGYGNAYCAQFAVWYEGACEVD
jgi:hypothetical protein